MTFDLWALKVAYLGRGYHGFQYQPGVGTVEGALRKALAKTGLDCRFEFASRTDTGVNALGQCITINTESKIRLDAINRCLPSDIVIWGISGVSREFNPRHDSKTKIYRYFIPPERLDVGSMQEVAALLQGRHDFRNFAKHDRKRPEIDTVRTLESLRITNDNGWHVLEFIAQSFLWQMCRRIAQHLRDVGRGICTVRETVNLLSDTFQDKKQVKSPPPAPPEYLFLNDIIYENVKFLLMPEFLEKMKAVAQQQQQLLEYQLKREKLFESAISALIQENRNDSPPC